MIHRRTAISLITGALPFILLLLLCKSQAYAADTLKIAITYLHRVGNSNLPSQRMVVSQKFHTADDTLFREIRYDDETGQISSYTFYFYSGGKLFSEETYNADDEIVSLLKYAYNKDGSVVRMVQTGKDLNAASPERETRYTYDKGGHVSKYKVLRNGKTAAVVKHEFDMNGMLTTFTAKYKALYDTISRKETRTFNYDASGRVIEIIVAGRDKEGQRYKRSVIYEYGGSDRPSAVSTLDDMGNLLSRKTYTYLASGTLGTCEETDGEGNVLVRLEYTYRINVMEKGAQRSILDPSIGF